MKRSARIKRIESELLARDYDGVTTVLTGDLIELKLEKDRYQELVKQALDNGTTEEWKNRVNKLLTE